PPGKCRRKCKASCRTPPNWQNCFRSNATAPQPAKNYAATFTACLASNFHCPFTFTQTSSTDKCAVPGFPPSFVVAERICRTQAVVPTTFTVCCVNSIVTKSELLFNNAPSNAALSWIFPFECPYV